MNKTVLFVAEKQAALDVVRTPPRPASASATSASTCTARTRRPRTCASSCAAPCDEPDRAQPGVLGCGPRAPSDRGRQPRAATRAALHEPGPAGLSAWTARQALPDVRRRPDSAGVRPPPSRGRSTPTRSTATRVRLTQALYDLGVHAGTHTHGDSRDCAADDRRELPDHRDGEPPLHRPRRPCSTRPCGTDRGRGHSTRSLAWLQAMTSPLRARHRDARSRHAGTPEWRAQLQRCTATPRRAARGRRARCCRPSRPTCHRRRPGRAADPREGRRRQAVQGQAAQGDRRRPGAGHPPAHGRPRHAHPDDRGADRTPRSRARETDELGRRAPGARAARATGTRSTTTPTRFARAQIARARAPRSRAAADRLTVADGATPHDAGPRRQVPALRDASDDAHDRRWRARPESLDGLARTARSVLAALTSSLPAWTGRPRALVQLGRWITRPFVAHRGSQAAGLERLRAGDRRGRRSRSTRSSRATAARHRRRGARRAALLARARRASTASPVTGDRNASPPARTRCAAT